MLPPISVGDLPPALRALLDRLGREGGEVRVTDGDRTVARLVGPGRQPGLDAGRLHIADDFDAPLPPDVLDGFEA